MTGRTIISEFHGWRGIRTLGGDLGIARTYGFVTFTYCPFLLSQWLGLRVSAMKNALKPVKVPAHPPKHVVRKR